MFSDGPGSWHGVRRGSRPAGMIAGSDWSARRMHWRAGGASRHHRDRHDRDQDHTEAIDE